MLRDRYPDRNARLLRSVLCKRQTDRPSVQQAGQVYSSAGQYSVQVYSGLVSAGSSTSRAGAATVAALAAAVF